MSDLKIREAFDSDSVPLKNIALKKAHDRIEKLETALRNVLRYQLSDETWGLLGFGPKKIRVEFDAARKALEGKDDAN